MSSVRSPSSTAQTRIGILLCPDTDMVIAKNIADTIILDVERLVTTYVVWMPMRLVVPVSSSSTRLVHGLQGTRRAIFAVLCKPPHERGSAATNVAQCIQLARRTSLTIGVVGNKQHLRATYIYVHIVTNYTSCTSESRHCPQMSLRVQGSTPPPSALPFAQHYSPRG